MNIIQLSIQQDFFQFSKCLQIRKLKEIYWPS